MNKIKNQLIKNIKYRKKYPFYTYIALIFLLIAMLFVVEVFEIGINANGSHLQFTAQSKDEVRITFVGDIMTSRYVQTEIDQRGLEALLQDAKNTWNGSNLVLANIENAVIERDIDDYYMIEKDVSFGTKVENILTLKELGIDVFGFANNHAADFGLIGLNETLNAIEEHDIDAVGIGSSMRNLNEFYKSYDINGLKIAIVAHSEIAPLGFAALNNKPGIATNYNEIAFQIIDRIRDEVDLIIMMVHWGDQYVLNVHEDIQSLGKSYIDLGVDVVIGSHPHVIQPIEKYNDGVIMYSMGNFVFDDTLESTSSTAMGSLIVDQDLNIKLEFIPFEIYQTSPHRVSKGVSHWIVKNQLTKLLDSGEFINNQGVIEVNIRGEKYAQK